MKKYNKKIKREGRSEDISIFLQQVLKNSGLSIAGPEFDLLHRWEEVVGAAIASQAQLKDVRDGTLFIKCYSSVWKNELELRKKAIFERSNQVIGKPVIRRMRFL